RLPTAACGPGASRIAAVTVEIEDRTMPARPLASTRVLILAATVIWVMACGSQSNPPAAPSGPTVASVAVTGSAPTIGTSAQISGAATPPQHREPHLTGQ